MFKRIITLLMACFFLGGSMFLPLGDFSLTRDIPQMYQNYTRIVAPEELSVIDFIGDYLCHGKEIFGHNEHDKPQSAAGNVQFQHQANPLTVVLSPVCLCVLTLSEIQKKYTFRNKPMMLSDYHQELFRPPLS